MGLRRIIAAFLAVLFATPAFAGAWTQPKGHGLFIAQATYFRSDAFFDQDGALTDQPTFSKFELQPYGEYGVTDRLTVGGSAYLQRVAQSGDDNYGVADPELFARYRIWQGAHDIFSVQPLIKLPSMFVDKGTPRGGSRSVDGELSVLYGRSMHILSDRDYIDMRAGYRVRSGFLADQWKFDATAGIFVTDALQLIPAVRSVISSDIGNAAFSENGEQDYDLTKVELTAAYHLNDARWMFATLYDHVTGINTGNGIGLSVGYAEAF